MNALLPSIALFLDDLVHPSAAFDAARLRQHRFFIAAHLIAGLGALVAIPLWLAFGGPLTVVETLALAWLASPIAAAAVLSRTGNLGAAHLVSAVSLTGAILWIAALSGGSHSPAVAWLVVVPLIAAQSGSVRIVMAAAAMTAFAVATLLVGFGIAPVADGFAGRIVIEGGTIVLAILAAGGLAARMDRDARAAAGSAREGEERYRLLADNVTDLITRHGPAGAVEFASPAARSLLRVSPAAVAGDGLLDRVHPADRKAYLDALRRSFQMRVPATVEFRLRRDGRDGEAADMVEVEMRCRPAVDATGRISAVVAVTRDVSERHARERELRAARETADRANHAKSNFLAHMSHELRTPLNAIIGFAGILKGDAGGRDAGERQREYATLIHAAGEHLLNVVNGILDMSKIESGMFSITPEPLAVGPLIADCCDMMAQQAEAADLVLSREVPGDLPAVAADRRALRQMAINLIANAIKFTPAGGSIAAGARAAGDTVEIYVRDTGIGIAEADLERIGTPFVQVDSSYQRRFEGTGLGLSLVKGLAALHGGQLRMESRLGMGTTATIVLPLRDPVTPPLPAAGDRRGRAFAEEEKERRHG
jgi:cell cycle sensor histidine kinase DivJ